MGYCPKCREEYEDYVKVCKSCDIELVDSLEGIKKEQILLTLNEEIEAKKIVEYLHFSEVKSTRYESKESEDMQTVFTVVVEQEDWSKAIKLVNVYLREEREETQEDYYFGEYETYDLEKEAAFKEQGSTNMFIGTLGIIGVIIGLLGVVKVLPMLNMITSVVILLLSGLLIVLTVVSKKSYPKKQEAFQSLKKTLDDLQDWAEQQEIVQRVELREKNLKEELTEESKYFWYMDVLTKEMEQNTITDDETAINTIAENIYEKRFI